MFFNLWKDRHKISQVYNQFNNSLYSKTKLESILKNKIKQLSGLQDKNIIESLQQFTQIIDASLQQSI